MDPSLSRVESADRAGQGSPGSPVGFFSLFKFLSLRKILFFGESAFVEGKGGCL